MANCKVVMFGKHSKKPLFVGEQTECIKWIMGQASEHIKLSDGRVLCRVLEYPDGDVYDVGQAVMFQILPADGNEIGLLNIIK